MIRCVSILLLLLLPLPAYADATRDMHVQSAFLFAKRHDWAEAVDHAQAAHDKVLVKYFTWEYLKDPQSQAGFDEITAFLEHNPDWPDKPVLEKRAEIALMASNPSDEALAAWFREHPPQTILAKFKTARTPEALQALIREAWVSDDYDQATEAKLLDKYHGILRGEDHARRIDRLLWEGKEDEAKRLLKYVSYDYQRLFMARLSLMQDKSSAPVDVVNVPPGLKSDPGLLYERLRWRMRGDDKDGVRELLLAAPAEVPYPEKWWVIRDRQIREAIGEDNTTLALRLLANHGQKEGSLSYKEMQWLAGWIELEFLHDPQTAYKRFTGLFAQVQTPGGKARAAYWAARAAEELKNGNVKHWLDEADDYPTTFYGQLAAWEADNETHLSIHSSTQPTSEEKAHFERRELVQLVHTLGAVHETDEAGKFIMYLVDTAPTSGEMILATRLGREVQRVDFGIRAAKKALQSDVISLESAYPTLNMSGMQPGVERALLLALIRQESEFYPEAISSSNAIGLMQLLPHTAKEIAKKSHMKFSKDRLFEPEYNMALGSVYLGKLIDHFDGSYVLAVASYNAGPGRVGQWVDSYGGPGHSVHEAIDWIEKIPNLETRGYVQHVLENTQVYRFVLAGKSVPVTIAQDLTR